MLRLLCTVFFGVLLVGSVVSAKGPPESVGKDKVLVPDYGDLIEILRDVDGVPILSDDGCLQPLDINKNTIPLDEECEMLEGYIPVEVDFGRLNIARSPSSVIEKRFDEVITYIKQSKAVSVDPAGRLMLQMEVLNLETNELETYWKTIDAPLECLALYTQVMKIGHLQTPSGIIASDNGDEIIFRPVLDPEVDYPKFDSTTRFLLPAIPGSTAVEPLSTEDMRHASFFLAGAGDKTSKVTVDLVQYINRILGVVTVSNALPENFGYVNFRNYAYKRGEVFTGSVPVIQQDVTPGTWKETTASLTVWLRYAMGEPELAGNIADFVQSGNESLAVIVFMHNYKVPEDLW